jgi:hypothetical protein
MTTFAEMETLVVGQTRRPEVSAVTQAAIRTATLRAHHIDFFARDLATGSLTYTPTSAATFYDFASISATLPRFRAMQQLQGLDQTSLAPVELLEYRELQDLYDSDNNRRLHIYTVIGDTLRAYPTLATGTLSAYYYQNPQTDMTLYSSWIANTYPDELATWAAAIVFARTGFAEMASDFQKTHVQSFKELLLASSLTVTAN